jgi:hypothetical protein
MNRNQLTALLAHLTALHHVINAMEQPEVDTDSPDLIAMSDAFAEEWSTQANALLTERQQDAWTRRCDKATQRECREHGLDLMRGLWGLQAENFVLRPRT